MITEIKQQTVLNYNRVTAPLSMDQIKDFFENKDVNFLIDYKNSQLKGHMLLTYISNLDLPCEIYIEDSPVEDIYALLHDYFTSKSLIDSITLKLLSAQIILDSKKMDSDYLFNQQILTKTQRQEFIKTHSALINNWNVFIGSSFYCCLTGIKELETELNFKNLFPVETDVNFVGYNIVNLFSVPSFSETYFSMPIQHEIKYFKTQFEECIFKGKNFNYYFNHSNNLIALTLEEYLTGNLSLDTLLKASDPNQIEYKKN